MGASTAVVAAGEGNSLQRASDRQTEVLTQLESLCVQKPGSMGLGGERKAGLAPPVGEANLSHRGRGRTTRRKLRKINS